MIVWLLKLYNEAAATPSIRRTWSANLAEQTVRYRWSQCCLWKNYYFDVIFLPGIYHKVNDTFIQKLMS